MSVVYATRTGQGEAGTVEDLIRYAAERFNGAGIRLPHTQLIRRIRRTFSETGASAARMMIDGFVIEVGRRRYAATWAGFELFTASGYADPTGARAAANVDRERGAL
jgi:hypothetical protein